jgi:hypothetical protein
LIDMRNALIWTLLALMLVGIIWIALRPAPPAPMPAIPAAVVGQVDPQDLPDKPASGPMTTAKRDRNQRTAYTQRLNTETDLPGYASELAKLAEAGDADAAAMLVELYEHCAGALYRAQDPPNRCDPLGPRGSETVERLRAESKRWLARAQQLGDPASQLRLPYYLAPPAGAPATPQELQLRQAVTTLIAEQDYTPLLRQTNLLADLSNRYQPQAFERAICALRVACAAEDRYCYMRNRCMQLLINPRAGEESRTPRENRILTTQQGEIEQALRQGDLSPIWRVSDPGDGG